MQDKISVTWSSKSSKELEAPTISSKSSTIHNLLILPNLPSPIKVRGQETTNATLDVKKSTVQNNEGRTFMENIDSSWPEEETESNLFTSFWSLPAKNQDSILDHLGKSISTLKGLKWSWEEAPSPSNSLMVEVKSPVTRTPSHHLLEPTVKINKRNYHTNLIVPSDDLILSIIKEPSEAVENKDLKAEAWLANHHKSEKTRHLKILSWNIAKWFIRSLECSPLQRKYDIPLLQEMWTANELLIEGYHSYTNTAISGMSPGRLKGDLGILISTALRVKCVHLNPLKEHAIAYTSIIRDF